MNLWKQLLAINHMTPGFDDVLSDLGISAHKPHFLMSVSATSRQVLKHTKTAEATY